MRRVVPSVLAVLVVLSTGCGATIASVNLRPERYYQQKVTVKGRITRTQAVDGDVLIEIADTREHRMLVRAQGALEETVGDWIKATGVLVPETRVGGQTLYDVLVAEEIEGTGAPWFANLT